MLYHSSELSFSNVFFRIEAYCSLEDPVHFRRRRQVRLEHTHVYPSSVQMEQTLGFVLDFQKDSHNPAEVTLVLNKALHNFARGFTA